jgi:hypothetical protein
MRSAAKVRSSSTLLSSAQPITRREYAGRAYAQRKLGNYDAAANNRFLLVVDDLWDARHLDRLVMGEMNRAAEAVVLGSERLNPTGAYLVP